ncbi:MAG: ATP-binding cassette domain-containing protein [Mesorhizobium sp.]|uniref:quaternary amine ABC transporter ATP-binding protein n=1 Tax=unclassified Mesorhizobium TaxID=325217 RepID=UPI000F758D13|nr:MULTISPECIES: glycine betaine/L-proline ABC transporter ATP-binding protein [unclassified Mesorhizobium]AZO48568.1 glycine betaine/L-proline ABC transporter ATP-binding protein [Mesorhizobium sp. M4B.F.Ca.ET.058.02.1.1]RVC45951.1 ATP-binding cassette domain-containing protein [Mesorhizobium sp. M4A.F.Ca.ET.090.04.2.1]RWC55222.1 MAG: ATP-binding cassette domain-containing protein [Mesorhizobium sp.]RWD15591.1 MAG: ATP-binding cassette domain-containing protein [Mesorhizobium sp.]RWD56477.1 M
MSDATEPQAAGAPRDARPIKLACRNVWKLFGANAASFIRERAGKASPTDIAAAGLVGAVRAVDLEIRQGEIFIIMGLSGSGKSTLVRCMSRLVEPSHGKVEFEGKDLLKISDAALIELRRHRMGMVFQNFALLPHLNVLDNIAFPLSIQGQDRATREGRAREVIELVGLRGREHFYPRELSGGQQQRVGIARSLATKPEIWFLDEPFSALDPLIRREMQDELMRLQTMLHKTIVFITHDFDEAIRLADRIAIMKDGEVIQTGTPEELVVNPATDYVAEFTRDVDRAKVISARSLMRACGGTEHGGTVSPEAKIASFSAGIVAAGKPFAVINGSGKPIGEVTPQAVIDLLAGIERSGAGA